MTAFRIFRVSQGSWPAVLGLPIALVDVDTESELVELEDLSRDGSRCSNHVLDPSPELLTYLFEYDLIIKGMIQGSILLIVGPLGIYGPVEHPLCHPALCLNSVLHLAEDTIQDSRDTAEESWLQLLDVIKQLERVSAVVAMREALDDGEDEDALLEGVTIGKVRDCDIRLVHSKGKLVNEVHAGHEAFVRQHGSFGVASCPRGITEHVDCIRLRLL